MGMSINRTIITFSLIILAFEGIWAAIVRLGNYDHNLYASLWWVNFLIYGATGFVAVRRVTLSNAILASMAVAAIDGTLGWGLSTLIGPGVLQKPQTWWSLLLAAI